MTADPFDADGAVWNRVSPKLALVRRTTFATSWVIVAAVVAVVLAVGDWWSVLPLWVTAPVLVGWLAVLAWMMWLIGRQVRAIGYAERPEELLVRSGRFFRRIVVVPYGRLQYVDVTAGPLSRALGFAAVRLHTASPGTLAEIPGVPAAEAARLRDRIAERGQAQLAGL